MIAPGKVLSFDLSKQDVGRTRTEGTVTLKLLLLEKNYAEIEMTNNAPLAPEVGDESPNPLLVEARDSTGQFLTRSGSINESAAQVAFYEKQLAEMQNRRPGPTPSRKSSSMSRKTSNTSRTAITPRSTSMA